MNKILGSYEYLIYISSLRSVEYVHVSSLECRTRSCHVMQIDNTFVENSEKFRYLAKIVTNQNYIHEEVNRLTNLENSTYHLVQTII
jgi:hypothetical protein